MPRLLKIVHSAVGFLVLSSPSVFFAQTPAGSVKMHSRYATFTNSLVSAMPVAQVQEGVTATPKLEFEVASVRQSDLYSDARRDDMDGYGAQTPTSSLFSANDSLMNYIRFAYHLDGSDVQMRPLFEELEAAHLNQGKFDVEARSEGVATREQVRGMVRSLLEDRFKLKTHYEVRQGPIYALMLETPGKLGPQLHLHPGDTPCTESARDAVQAGPDGAAPPCGGTAIDRTSKSLLAVSMTAVPISRFVDVITPLGQVNGGLSSEIPIVDETGLKGNYDLQLQFAYSPPASRPDAEVPGPGSPTLIEALKKQLGMHLVKTTGPQSLLVIDHVERPSAN